MRGQQVFVVRRWTAAGAALLLSCTLASCSSDGDTSANRPRQDNAPAPVAADENTLAQVASSGVRTPDWMPATLPMPEGASLTAVGRDSCTVTFLVSAHDAQVTGGTVGASARANGLAVELVSSTSETAAPQPEVEPGLFAEEEVPVAPVVTHVEVLRLQGPSGEAKGAPIDATLTLTSRGDGMVTGEYALPGGTCAS